MKKQFLFVFLFAFWLNAMGQYPKILTSTVMPSGPTIFSPVQILTAYGTGNKSYKIDKSFVVNTVQKTIQLQACYWQTWATQGVLQKDTFNVGQLPAGVYSVTFSTIGSFSASACIPNVNTYTFATFSFEVFADAVSLNETVEYKDLGIYPNPVTDHLTLEAPTDSYRELSYQVYNALGQQIEAGMFLNPKVQLGLTDQPPGIYIIRLQNKAAKQERSFKFVKE